MMFPEYKLNRWQRLRISRGWPVPVGKHRREGWSGPIMFYAFKCDKHGIVTNYQQGHAQILRCPKCSLIKKELK